MASSEVERLKSTFGLTEGEALLIAADAQIQAYFEDACRHTTHYRMVAHWLNGPIRSIKKRQAEMPISAEVLGQLVNLVKDGTISYNVAVQRVLPELMVYTTGQPLDIAKRMLLIQENNEAELAPIIDQILHELPLKVEAYQKGKKGILSMFMGEVMKRTQGKANPNIASRILLEKLKLQVI